MGKKKKTDLDSPVEQAYTVPEKFRLTPRAYRLNGKWVGIGGDIIRKGKPPKGDVFIPEATDEEYMQINNSYLVQK